MCDIVSRKNILGQVGVVSAGFALRQIIRLGTNIILASIISPAIFGIMMILNTLRTGAEQITDVGLGQNIVYDRLGGRKLFYNTAWTMQIIRGVLLYGIFLLLSPLFADTFGEGELEDLFPIFATIFIITGLVPPARFLLQKQQRLLELTIIELIVAVLGAIAIIGMALYSPTAEAIVWALLLGNLFAVFGYLFGMDWRALRLQLSRRTALRILSFGKWVFVATLLYFAANSFDRLYLGAEVPLTLLGIYSIARSLSEAGYTLALRISQFVVFPKVAEAHNRGEGLASLVKPRGRGLIVTALFLGVGIAISDQVIYLLYDERYEAAAVMLPFLLVGVWYSILSIIFESIVYGTGRPALNAWGNAAKLVWLVVGLPLALTQEGFIWALAVIAAADVPRYLILSAALLKERLGFFRQDLLATAVLLGSAALLRWALVATGLVKTFWPDLQTGLM